MFNVIKKKLGRATFGSLLFSGVVRSHEVKTLLLGGRYFQRVVTFGTLR